MGKVLEAIEGFATEIDGRTVIITRSVTRVDESHELAQRFPQHFRPVEDGLTYGTEAATDNPGEGRQAVFHAPDQSPPAPPAEEPKAEEKPPQEQASSSSRQSRGK